MKTALGLVASTTYSGSISAHHEKIERAELCLRTRMPELMAWAGQRSAVWETEPRERIEHETSSMMT